MVLRVRRTVGIAVITAGLVMVPAVSAVAAAATCAVSVPATAPIGSPVTIEGSGFPSASSVDITITLGDGTRDEFPVQADAGGRFEIVITPEGSEAGQASIVATAGTACSASASFVIGAGGLNATPPAGDDDPRAPRTDTAPTEPRTPTSSPLAWVLAITLIVGGVSGGVISRRQMSRLER